MYHIPPILEKIAPPYVDAILLLNEQLNIVT